MLLTGTGRPLHTAILPTKVAVLGLYLLALVLLYHLLTAQASRWIALATVAVTAVNPLLTALAVEPMSEGPFMAASVLSLWLLHRAIAGSSPGLALPLAAGLAAGLAWAIPHARRRPGARGCGGVPFVPTVSGSRLRPEAAGAGCRLCAGGFALSGALVALQLLRPGPACGKADGRTPVICALTAVDPYAPRTATATLSDIASRIVVNGRLYGLGLSLFLFGQPWRRLPRTG